MKPVNKVKSGMKAVKRKNEKNDSPEQALAEFYEYASPAQARWYLWEMFKVMVTGSYGGLDAREQSNLVYFYERLEGLINAVNLIREKKNQI